MSLAVARGNRKARVCVFRTSRGVAGSASRERTSPFKALAGKDTADRFGMRGRIANLLATSLKSSHPKAIYKPSNGMEKRFAMADNVHELRAKTPDSEKITVNLGFIDLGRIDLMVRDGFYANRADFIRTAVRNQLERQEDAVRQSVERRQLKLGLSHYSRQDLEAARDKGSPLHIQVLGLASIASDVTPELARAAIASVQVLGAFQAHSAVKAALADRTA